MEKYLPGTITFFSGLKEGCGQVFVARVLFWSWLGGGTTFRSTSSLMVLAVHGRMDLRLWLCLLFKEASSGFLAAAAAALFLPGF